MCVCYLVGDGCAGGSDRFRVPITINFGSVETSSTNDGRNAAAAGEKRWRSKKQEEPSTGGRINAMREQNGRFMKVPSTAKCAGKPLTIKAIRSEPPANDADSLTHN